MSQARPESERASDILDVASALTEVMTEGYVNEARRKAQPEQTQRADGSWPHPECTDCGGEIESGRLALGKIRCLGCQAARELRRKQGLA